MFESVSLATKREVEKVRESVPAVVATAVKSAIKNNESSQGQLSKTLRTAIQTVFVSY